MSYPKLSAVLTLALLLSAAPLAAAVPSSERAALVALYQSTGGEGWLDTTGWLGPSGTECAWYGVTCDESGSTVVDVALWSNNLVGTIPPEIGALGNLVGLALAANELIGAIPSTIGQLTKLKSLNLQENALSGPIPVSIGNLVELEELYLFANQLTGSIPPSIGQLVNVRELALGNNLLTGALPHELGNLSSIRFLELGGLQLSGTIPSSLGQLSNLEWFSLEGNQLSGPIPSSLGQLANLKTLDLQYNALDGPIPAQLGGLVSIEELRLSGNQLSGTIPSELMTLSTLKSLTLDGNQLSGGVPSSIGNLFDLEYLALGFNELSGTIPPELGTLAHLTVLDMPGNRFSGEIPPELGDASSLVYLDLAANQDRDSTLGGLSGSIPPRLGKLSNLRTLELSGNDLGGPIPVELGDLTNLEWLGLAENRLTGVIPGALSKLSELRWLSLYGNRLEGSIPPWLGQLTNLTGVLLGGNSLTGVIPANVTDLTRMETLDICGNFITGGIPGDIGKLTSLAYLSLCGNDLSGTIPEGFWTLEGLIDVRLDDNQLSGSIPAGIRNLENLEVLLLGYNQIEGPLPPEIGDLPSIVVLGLDGNRFSGMIPPQIGQLTQLQFLGLSDNALRGSIPTGLMNLVNLGSGSLRLGHNALFTNDSQLRSFINAVHEGGPFEDSQTVPPENVAVSEVTDRSAIISWTPIAFIHGDGGYEVTAEPIVGGAPIVTTTSSKQLGATILQGLSAESTYRVTVRSTTHPHGFQQNFVRSDPSTPLTFTTGPRVTAPASVGIVALAGGLIQIGGVPQNTTTYALANFGDVATEITLGQAGSFFTQSPATFTLEGGETQIITVSSVPDQPPDSYWGTAIPSGDGVPEDLYITVQLLSVETPAGESIAEATTSRVELSGSAGTDSVGTVTFRNVGTSTLRGLLISDVEWIDTPAALIEIPAGELRNVNFTVRRSKRPDAGTGGGGTLFATIRLVYLDGGDPVSASAFRPASSASVSQSIVTVVDTVKVSVTPSQIPPLGPNEIIRFATGVVSFNDIFSNVIIGNPFGSRNLSDLRIFFKPSGSGGAAVATPGTLVPSQSMVFASVVDSIFERKSSVGTVLVRTDDPQHVLVSALRSNASRAAGLFAGATPIFRSDRAAGAGEALHLAGIRSGESFTTTLYIQEVSGLGASATLAAYDASGNLLGSKRTIDAIGAFAMIEESDIPAAAVTLVVANDADSAGRIVAWALVEDTPTGDNWAVVDWPRFHGYSASEQQRVPLVMRDGEAPSRRRPVRRHRSGDSSLQALSGLPASSTSVALFNPATTNAVIRITHWQAGSASERNVTLLPRQTRVIEDVVTFVRGGNARSLGYVVLTPLSGSVLATARMETPAATGGAFGAGVPVVAASSGLRLGQARMFAGLEDSTESTVNAAAGGTARTSFGIAEFAGKSVTVRATLHGVGGRLLATANLSRDFVVSPNSVIVVDDMARAILGPRRDTLLGDLRNLQLELRVVEGEGAATVFVLTTDNGSNDPVLRLE
jgi:Leucine-rich repeat (LRR) protein